jgi:pre-mRNA cleavage complex 2 protein Pcf11
VCAACGLRFAETPDGRAAFGAHMDWHFRRNRRDKERQRKAVPREWYLPAQVWTSVADAAAFVDARHGT